MKHLLTVLILLALSFNLWAKNLYDEYEEVQTRIIKGETKQALEFLAKKEKNPVNKGLYPKIYYLTAWAHYANNNPVKAMEYARKVAVDYKTSSFYYPAVFLTARIFLLQGDENNAVRLFDFILQKKDKVEPQYIFAAAMFKSLIKKDSASNYLSFFELDVFRLCFDLLASKKIEVVFEKKAVETKTEGTEKKNECKQEETKKEEVKKDEEKKPEKDKQTEEKKEIAKDGMKEVKEEEKKETKTETKEDKKEVVSCFEFLRDNSSNDEMTAKFEEILKQQNIEIERLKKEIESKQKEMDVLKMLLTEKKRLLQLKEKYLDERDRQDKQKDTKENKDSKDTTKKEK